MKQLWPKPGLGGPKNKKSNTETGFWRSRGFGWSREATTYDRVAQRINKCDQRRVWVAQRNHTITTGWYTESGWPRQS